MWHMGATLFEECQEAGDRGASARLSHLCVICAGLLQASSVGSSFNGSFSPNQLRLMHQCFGSLKTHLYNTFKSSQRKKSCRYSCLISKLAWLRTTIPNNLKSVLTDCGCNELCTCVRIHAYVSDWFCVCVG